PGPLDLRFPVYLGGAFSLVPHRERAAPVAGCLEMAWVFKDMKGIFPVINDYPNIARISSVFSLSKTGSPRVSTLRRSTGSVLEGRRLKRQLGNSRLRPSVRSSFRAPGA